MALLSRKGKHRNDVDREERRYALRSCVVYPRAGVGKDHELCPLFALVAERPQCAGHCTQRKASRILRLRNLDNEIEGRTPNFFTFFTRFESFQKFAVRPSISPFLLVSLLLMG